MKKYLFLLTVLLLMAAGQSCSSDDDGQAPEPVIDPVELPETTKLTRSEQELVNHSNEFAFTLFRQAQDVKISQVLSPLSVTFALGMLNNGAAGMTQVQINNVLGFGHTGADGINQFCYKMLTMAPELDSLTKVMIANAIYMNQPRQLLPTFEAKAKSFYNATLESRNFYDGKTMDVINQWVSDHTETMIRRVFTEASFNPDAASYLLNAIYFKGSWTNKFDKELTTKEEFCHAGESEELSYCDMMHQSGKFKYGETDDFQILRMPYGNESYQMTVLLPKVHEGQPANVLPTVPTAAEWQQMNEKMYTQLVYISFPRFETDTNIDLMPIMYRLGMTKAFQIGVAEFPEFCNTETYIDDIFQVAKIKVNEEGTEAAAVTVIEGVDGVGHEDHIKVFRANHPFLYVISDKNTGAVFFIGQYTGN